MGQSLLMLGLRVGATVRLRGGEQIKFRSPFGVVQERSYKKYYPLRNFSDFIRLMTRGLELSPTMDLVLFRLGRREKV